jgi:hypothetical protein
VATVRWRRFSPIVFPTWCYVAGVALTVFIERYREMADILLFVPLGGLIADVLFRTTDCGVWPSRPVKRVTALLAIGVSVLLHAFGIAQPWHWFPEVEARAPNVSGLAFQPVSFAEPVDAYVSRWSYSAAEPLITRQDDGLLCSFPGRGEGSGVQYGGIRFPVIQPEAIKLELSFQQPDNIDGVFVEGYDATGNRRLRWQWLSSSRTPLPDGRRRYTFVPGRSVAFFRPKGPAEAAGVVEIRVLVRAPVDNSTGFMLHSAEVAPLRGLPPMDFTPAAFDGDVAQYASPWGGSLPSRTVEQEGGGLRFRGQAGEKRVYGGVRFPCPPKTDGLLLQMSFDNPRDIRTVYVDGHNTAGERIARWTWTSRQPHVLRKEGPYPFLLVTGRDFGPFVCDLTGPLDRVREVHVFIRMKPGTEAGFLLQSVEFGRVLPTRSQPNGELRDAGPE